MQPSSPGRRKRAPRLFIDDSTAVQAGPAETGIGRGASIVFRPRRVPMTTSIPLSKPWIDKAEIDRVTRALTGRLSGDGPSATLVICPSFTFSSTANAILRTGAQKGGALVLMDGELAVKAEIIREKGRSCPSLMTEGDVERVIEQVRRTPARPEP